MVYTVQYNILIFWEKFLFFGLWVMITGIEIKKKMFGTFWYMRGLSMLKYITLLSCSYITDEKSRYSNFWRCTSGL